MELSIGLMAKSVGHSRRTCRWRAEAAEGRQGQRSQVRGHRSSTPNKRHLSDVHAGVTGQGSRRGQVMAAEHRGDDPVKIHFPDHRPVHKVDQTVSISSDP